MGDARSAAVAARQVSIEASADVQAASNDVICGVESVANVAVVLREQSQAVAELARSVNGAAASGSSARELVVGVGDEIVDLEHEISGRLADFESRNIENYILYRAKSDHILWKKRLASLLAGRAELSEQELSDHHSCRLGHWWDEAASSSPELAALPAFQAIETPHCIVHEQGRLAAQLFNVDDHKGAHAAFEKMEEASAEVVEKLDALINEMEGRKAG